MLSYKEKELIKDYMKRKKNFELNDICHYLIENGSSKDTYSTGKLKIYPYVAVYLKQFTASSEIEIGKNEQNYTYSIKEEVFKEKEIKVPAEVEVKEDKKQKKKVTDEDEQLTLFL